MKIAALATLLAALPPAAEASVECRTQAEARAIWPNSYLAYRMNKGRRCWFAPSKPPPAKEVKPPEPQPTWTMNPVPWDQSIWYPPGWEADPVYSTFQGEPPDVWPSLPELEWPFRKDEQ